MHVASTNPESVESLLGEAFIKDPKQTIDDLLKALILKLGENIAIGEIVRFEV
jgi:translation elongation factor EF-Ts